MTAQSLGSSLRGTNVKTRTVLHPASRWTVGSDASSNMSRPSSLPNGAYKDTHYHCITEPPIESDVNSLTVLE